MNAKRRAPEVVPPVTLDGIQYSVPHFSALSQGMDHNGGYVEAVDLDSGKRIWLKEIYRPLSYPNHRESDVNDIFIRSMKLEGRGLKIIDEKGNGYDLLVK